MPSVFSLGAIQPAFYFGGRGFPISKMSKKVYLITSFIVATDGKHATLRAYDADTSHYNILTDAAFITRESRVLSNSFFIEVAVCNSYIQQPSTYQ